jgi:hypothetical protein
VVTGVVAVATLIRLRGEGSDALYMGLNAAFCLIFGVLLAFRHAQGALGNAGILSLFAILYCVVLLLIGRKAHGGEP